jgi:hypothetical protein
LPSSCVVREYSYTSTPLWALKAFLGWTLPFTPHKNIKGKQRLCYKSAVIIHQNAVGIYNLLMSNSLKILDLMTIITVWSVPTGSKHSACHLVSKLIPSDYWNSFHKDTKWQKSTERRKNDKRQETGRNRQQNTSGRKSQIVWGNLVSLRLASDWYFTSPSIS